MPFAERARPQLARSAGWPRRSEPFGRRHEIARRPTPLRPVGAGRHRRVDGREMTARRAQYGEHRDRENHPSHTRQLTARGDIVTGEMRRKATAEIAETAERRFL